MVVYYTDQQSMQKVEVLCLAHRAFCESFTHQTEQVKKGPPTNQSTELQGPRPFLTTNAQYQVNNILNCQRECQATEGSAREDSTTTNRRPFNRRKINVSMEEKSKQLWKKVENLC